METEAPRKAGTSPVIVAVGLLVFCGFVAVSFPVILKQSKAADRTTAISGLKFIGACLIEFDTEYGGFPDDKTALEVKKATKTDFTLTGTYSNDYFRQMLAGGGGKSEKPFWCRTAQSPKRCDDDFSTPVRALAAGEVGYSYIMASPTQGLSANGEPSCPVVVAPSYQFRADWTFDPEPYAAKMVALRIDNSAAAMTIDDDRKVHTNAGKTLEETGEGTPWGTKITPFLRAPRPR